MTVISPCSIHDMHFAIYFYCAVYHISCSWKRGVMIYSHMDMSSCSTACWCWVCQCFIVTVLLIIISSVPCKINPCHCLSLILHCTCDTPNMILSIVAKLLSWIYELNIRIDALVLRYILLDSRQRVIGQYLFCHVNEAVLSNKPSTNEPACRNGLVRNGIMTVKPSVRGAPEQSVSVTVQ